MGVYIVSTSNPNSSHKKNNWGHSRNLNLKTMNALIASKFATFENTNSDYKAENLGPLVTVFKGYDFKFQDKNVGKKATFTFFDKDGKTLNVVLSTKLDNMYRAGQISKLQLIGCDVIMMDLINQTTKELIAEGVLRLQAPVSGLVKMAELTAETYVDALAGF